MLSSKCIQVFLSPRKFRSATFPLRSAILWDSLPRGFFPEYFNLNFSTSNVNHYLSFFFLISSSCQFLFHSYHISHFDPLRKMYTLIYFQSTVCRHLFSVFVYDNYIWSPAPKTELGAMFESQSPNEIYFFSKINYILYIVLHIQIQVVCTVSSSFLPSHRYYRYLLN